MSRSLNAFLNPIQVENEHVAVSKRFLEDGKPVKWEIRAITSAENDILLKKNSKKDKKGMETFDRLGHQNDLMVAAVVYPDLHNAELQKAYGVMGAPQLLGKMLTVGEATFLATEIKRISGLDDDTEDLVEEVKND